MKFLLSQMQSKVASKVRTTVNQTTDPTQSTHHMYLLRAGSKDGFTCFDDQQGLALKDRLSKMLDATRQLTAVRDR